jgi:transporter family-2 protein
LWKVNVVLESLAIPFLLLVGSLLALQAAANVQLSTATGSPFGASTLQLGIGAALLLVATAAAGTVGAFGLVADAEPGHLLGGLGSALYITSGILLFPRLGAVVTVGLWITGQMLGSLALDGFGWLGVEPEPLGVAQVLGGVAVVAGAALIVKAQAGGTSLDRAMRERAGWLALALAAGAALPVQGAVNAQLRVELDAPVAAGAVSFVVATTAMGLLLIGSLALAGAPRPRVAPLRDVPWWGWLGGLCGAAYVTAVFVLIPEIGAAPTIALTVAGQQVASVFVDRFGLLRLAPRPVTARRLAAVATLLAGVGLITVA